MKLKSLVLPLIFAAASFNASAVNYDLGTLNPAEFDTLAGFSTSYGANYAIDDTWTFTVLTSSDTSFAAQQTFAVTQGAIKNFSAELIGTGSFDPADQGKKTQSLSWEGPLAAGTYTVHITGMTQLAGARYTATVAALPVPEPETYAMMLAGLGLVGAIARRRAAKKQ